MRLSRPNRATNHGNEIPVTVHRREALLVLGPIGGNAATPDHRSGLDLEDVGKIATRGDLKIDAHRRSAVVGQIEILVQPAAPEPMPDR